MRYSAGSIRHIRDDIWQARFTYYEDPDDHTTKKQTARNFRASSEREAQQEKARIHDQLEREAEFAAFFPSEVSIPTTLEDYLMWSTSEGAIMRLVPSASTSSSSSAKKSSSRLRSS